MADLSFVHRFEPGTASDAAFLLLHGTGGNENDLVPLAQMIAPGSAVLSPRGKVLENGMARFFRRLAAGVFDEDDVRARANELADFVESARAHYGIEAPIALGYSNGANIAAAVMMLRPTVLAGAILLRATFPLADPRLGNELAGKPVLILSGSTDAQVPAANGERLRDMLAQAGAEVTQRVLPVGHELSQADVTLAREWLSRQTDRASATAQG